MARKSNRTISVDAASTVTQGDPTLKPPLTKDEADQLVQQAHYKKWLDNEYRFDILKGAQAHRKKLSHRMIQAFCAALVRGHYPEVACKTVGVTMNSMTAWLKKGFEDYDKCEILLEQGVKIRPKDISIEHELYVNMQDALFQAEDRDLMKINLAAELGNVGAIFWKMERRNASRWGRKDKTDINVNANINGQVQHVIMTPDQSPTLEQWKKERETRDVTKTIEHYSTLPSKPSSTPVESMVR